MTEDDDIIHSPLERSVTEAGSTVKIAIYRASSSHWILEVEDEFGNSTVYNEEFPSDQAALDEALEQIEAHGIGVFVGEPSPYLTAAAPDDWSDTPDIFADLHKPLSDDELSSLRHMLLFEVDHDDVMTLEILDGYLHALALGPVTIMPSTWLPKVWGQTVAEGMLPALGDLAQADHLLGLVMRHFNGIVARLESETPQLMPLWNEYTSEGKTYDDGEAWAYGFVLGVKLAQAAWAPLLNSEAGRQCYRPIGLLAERDFSADQDELTQTPQQRHELTLLLPDAVLQLHKHCLPLRLAAQARAVARAMQPKVGRNQPCPCGSRQKFKKCCGAPVNLH